MFIKFKPTSSGNGLIGFCNAVAAACTAAAGATPVKPLYVDTWEVVANTVAGGWTAGTNTTSTSSSNGQYAEFINTSGQARFRKRVRFYMDSTSSTYGKWSPYSYYDYDTDGRTGNQTWTQMFSQKWAIGGSTTTTDYRVFDWTYWPYNNTWAISVTADYMYLINLTSTVSHARMPNGIANIKGNDDYYTNGPEFAFDFATIFHCGTSNTTNAAANSGEFIHKPVYIQSSYNPLGYKTATYTNMAQFGSTINMSSQVMQMGEAFDGTVRQAYNGYSGMMSRTSGGLVPALYPMYIGSPWYTGEPFGQLAGFKFMGAMDTVNMSEYVNNTNKFKELQSGLFFTDADSNKWFVTSKVNTNGNRRAIQVQ